MRFPVLHALAAFLLTAAVFGQNASTPTPPVAEKIHKEKQINGFGDSFGGMSGWGGWGPWGNSMGTFSANTSSTYIGTVVVGMYDPAVKKLVWIGAAQHAIEPGKNQEKNQQKLNKGAQKLLKDFPLGRGK